MQETALTLQRALLPCILIMSRLSLVASLIDAIFAFNHHCFHPV